MDCGFFMQEFKRRLLDIVVHSFVIFCLVFRFCGYGFILSYNANHMYHCKWSCICHPFSDIGPCQQF